MTTETAPDRSPAAPSTLRGGRRIGDAVFAFLSTFSGSLILAILAAVALFLIAQGAPAFGPVDLENPASGDLRTGATNLANPEGDPSFFWYVLPLVFGTVWSSLIALIVAFPVAIGVALFISHYAPRSIATVLGYIVDLLAAVPSVVFGLWGNRVFGPLLVPVYTWLNENLGWIPLFAGPVSVTGRTMLTAALVLAIMVLPIITSLSREVFLQTPKLHEEAALALGATRLELIRMAVLPFARSGVIAATMLALGRALGETMAVAMVLSPKTIISFALISSDNPATIASQIALNFPEAHGMGVSTLIACGLVLFAITLIVNTIARWIVNRRSDFSGAN